MRQIAVALLIVAVGCNTQAKTPEQERAEVFAAAETPSGPSACKDIEQLEAWSGKYITLVGRFDHLNFKHGIITLPSGLKVYIPHFDQKLLGDDWFKYIGQKCYAYGRLQTFTKNIEGYRGPSLELYDFSGP